jgi:hypothetical protein
MAVGDPFNILERTMKTTLLFATIPLSLAVGCATVDDVKVASASGASYYCAKDRLTESGGKLSCNWSPTAKDACRNFTVAKLEKGSVASGPTDSGRCETGDWLIRVTTR